MDGSADRIHQPQRVFLVTPVTVSHEPFPVRRTICGISGSILAIFPDEYHVMVSCRFVDQAGINAILNDPFIDAYMNNDDITLEEMGEYREILFCRLRDAYSKSNRNMIELIENECGPVEVQFLDVYSPLCIIKMSDTQAYILSDSNLPVYIEPFINIAAELE